MKIPLQRRRASSGAAMLVALLFVFASTIAITAWMCLMTSRVLQAEAQDSVAQRHTEWGNTSAINTTYAHYQGFRDGNISQSALNARVATGTVASPLYWGGIDSSGWNCEAKFSTVIPTVTSFLRTMQRHDGSDDSPQLFYTLPYNNLQPWATSDRSVYFERTVATSDYFSADRPNAATTATPVERFTMYNYLMSYPSQLLGDLLIIHKASSAGGGTYSMNPNTTVNGRVVIWDKTATAANLRSDSVLCRYTGSTGVVSTKNAAGTAPVMPDNWGITPSATAGNGSTASSPAVTDGTLNMANNADFQPASLYHMAVSGSYNATCTTWNGLGNSGVITDPSYETAVPKNSAAYPAPATSPYNYTPSGQMNTVWVNLLNVSLNNIYVSGNFEQVVLVGVANQTDYNTQDTLSPVIIVIDEDKLRDIRFVGENNRRVILAIRKTSANSVYMGFTGVSSVVGGHLRWRLNLVNETGAMWIDPPVGNSLDITGGIRTNWQFNCTDVTSTQRINLFQESSPGLLESWLPRDSYFSTYTLVR